MHRDNIPQLSEKEIEMILVLAENGPMSGYDFHLGGRSQRGNRKALMSSSHWLTVKRHLGDQGENFITCLKPRGRPQKDRQGRRKNLFWLTPRGSALALLNDADSGKLRENALEVYRNDEDEKVAMELYFELREIGGLKLARYLDKSIVLIGRVEPLDFLLRILPDIHSIGVEKINEVISKFKKKYPKYWKQYSQPTLEEIWKDLGRLLGYE